MPCSLYKKLRSQIDVDHSAALVRPFEVFRSDEATGGEFDDPVPMAVIAGLLVDRRPTAERGSNPLLRVTKVRRAMTALFAARPLLEAACAQPEVCSGCNAHKIGLCASLDAEALRDVAASGERICFGPREVLFRQGDPAAHIFILNDGTARLTHLLPDGRQAAVGLRFGGDVLGFTTEEAHHLGAEALTAATACRISRRELDRLLRQHPGLERQFIDLCARELAATQSHLVALGRFTAEERVAAFLISLAEAQERRGHQGPVFDVPTTRADVGELLGLTLETVSRAVSTFRRRGWLRARGLHEVELLDRAALASLASGEGPGHE
jgi:CRP/FNR family transcriptional regulator